jgi:hypothetical protein
MSGWKSRIKAYDEQSLIDLTSVGLVRRARKQVTEEQVRLLPEEATDNQLVFAVGAQTVALKDGPLTKASCDCRATGLCVHILAAVLYARQAGCLDEGGTVSPAGEKPPADIEAEIGACDPSAIFKWAGKPALRLALQLLARLPEQDRRVVVGDTSLEILLGEAVRCRFVARGGLDGIICDAPDHRRKGVIAAGLLYWWQQRGVAIQWPADLGGGETGNILLSEDESQLVEAIRGHLTGMLDAGLMHLPRHLEDALRDLAWSARGGRLPRLSVLLLQLVGEMEAFRQGQAGAESRILLDRVAAVHSLCEALACSPMEAMDGLRGQFRRDYLPSAVGPLWLAGACQYQTRSGAKGLSLMLWDLESRRPYRVNLGRSGEASREFDPAAAWRAALGWQKGSSPEALNNKVLRLENVKVSGDGRLSLSGDTRLAAVADAASAAEAIGYLGYTHWEPLGRALADEIQPPEPMPQPVLVRPRRIKPWVLDEIDQQWIGWAQDEAGQWLRLALPVGDRHNPRVAGFNRCLAAIENDIWGLVLEPRLVQQELQLAPVSLIVKSKGSFAVLHPDLEFIDLKQQSTLGNWVKRLVPRKSDGAPELAQAQSPTARLEKWMAHIQDMILGAAEIGLACGYLDPQQTHAFATSLDSAGARHLATSMVRLGRRKDSATLVQAHYAFQLAWRRLQIDRLVHRFDS